MVQAQMTGHAPKEGGTSNWLTPPEIINALGKFDLDPCAAADQPWSTAKKMYTIKDDGLTAKWSGRVWMNCPYGAEAKDWMKRMAEHSNGIALLFARTETAMFFESIWRRATGIMFLRGRIRFYKKERTRYVQREASPSPSVLIAYDRDDETTTNSELLRQSGLDGYYVDLSPSEVVWRGWRDVVVKALVEKPRQLHELYDLVEKTVNRPENKNVRPKIRQILYLHEGDVFVRQGEFWTLRAA